MNKIAIARFRLPVSGPVCLLPSAITDEGLGVVDQFVAALHLPLSSIRLERYRPMNGPNLDMLTNYFWNMALAEALYPALHAVEVALRNSVNTTLVNRYGTQRWWNQQWVLLPRQLQTIQTIEHDYYAEHGIAITPGRLIAELSFGFWTTILSYPYESRIWRYRQFVLLGQVFPHAGGLPRGDVHRRFNRIRFLRNRVMHYEAIYDRPNLAQEHAEILQAIRWISPDLYRGIATVDGFNDVQKQGRRRVLNNLRTMLGDP